MFGLLENNDIYVKFDYEGETLYVTKNYDHTINEDLHAYSWSIIDENGYRLDKYDYGQAFLMGQDLIKSGNYKTGNGVGSLFGEDTSLEGQEIAKQMLESISE